MADKKNVEFKNVRLSFAAVTEPIFKDRNQPDGDKQFTVTFLVDKKDEQAKNVCEEIKDIVPTSGKALLTAKGSVKPTEFFSAKSFEGLEEEDIADKDKIFVGNYHVTAKTKSDYPPKLWNEKGEEMSKEEAKKRIFAGCFVNIKVSVGYGEYNGKPYFAKYLQHIQIVDDSESLRLNDFTPNSNSGNGGGCPFGSTVASTATTEQTNETPTEEDGDLPF